jgi:hypothetical protein
MGGIHFSSDMYGTLVNEIPVYVLKNLSGITPSNIFGLLFLPSNKGVGLVPILLVSIVGILIYLIKYKRCPKCTEIYVERKKYENYNRK